MSPTKIIKGDNSTLPPLLTRVIMHLHPLPNYRGYAKHKVVIGVLAANVTEPIFMVEQLDLHEWINTKEVGAMPEGNYKELSRCYVYAWEHLPKVCYQ